MNKCISCGVNLPPLDCSEENDFAVECEYCETHEEETDDYECEHCGGDHSSFLCKHITRFDDMDCFKCGDMTKKPMTIEEMVKRWPECPPHKAVTVDFQFIEKDENGIRRREIEFIINQDTIKEIREYLDAVEECMNS